MRRLFSLVFQCFYHRTVELDCATVNNDVESLKELCRDGEKPALESIRFTSGLN